MFLSYLSLLTLCYSMHPQLEVIFDEAENCYLKSEELNLINQYISSLPDRLESYRLVRDQELEIMQRVADQLQAEMPREPVELLERCLQNALLVLRYSAMGMLLGDETFVQQRLLGWLSGTMRAYSTYTIDATLHRLLNQQLIQTLNTQQLHLLSPQLDSIRTLLNQEISNTVAVS